MIEVSATINDDAVLKLVPKDGDRDRALLKIALESRVLVSHQEQEDGSWHLTFRDVGKVKDVKQRLPE